MRMICTAIFLALSLFLQTSQAQTPIDFSDVAKPLVQQKVYRWDVSNPNCKNYTKNDALITTMDTPEAHIWVTLLPPASAKDLKKYLILSVMIINKGGRAFNVEPKKITLTVLGKKSFTLSALPLEEVLKKIRKHGSSSFFIGLRPTRTATATVTDPQGNVSSVAVRVPDTETEAAEERADAELRARQQSRANETYDLGLKANTLFKDQDAMGAIFFDKKKAVTDGGFILNIPLGDFAFEIPFGKARSGT